MHPATFRTLARIVAVVGLIAVTDAKACGPEFPSSYLETDGEATLPWIDFGFSLLDIAKTYKTLAPGTPKFEPSRLRGGEAELADFAARLNEPDLKQRLSDSERTGMLADYRTAIQEEGKPEQPPNFKFPPALQPVLREFALYHEGVAWLDSDAAEDGSFPKAWNALLALPEPQRRFRTTWVHYMSAILHAKAGRFTESHQSYQALRDAATAGFHDTCGLAYASFRREYLDGKDDIVRQLAAAPAAILFYSQYTNAPDFRRLTLDLQATCRKKKRLPNPVLKSIAADPVASEVFIAFCADRYYVDNATTDRFLALLPPQPLKGAERVAFIAYTRNDEVRTRQWLAVTPADSLVGLWLKAELHRRAGRYALAADAYRAWLHRYETLTRNAKSVPTAPDLSSTRTRWRPYFVPDTIAAVPFFDDEQYYIGRTFNQEIYARLGTTLVHNRDFLQALDGFIRASAWTDAAYVAETLVSLNELRKYVDAASTPEIVRLCAALVTPVGGEWRPSDHPYAAFYDKGLEEGNKLALAHINSTDRQRVFIRYLLGRRLVREGHASEAAPYLPAQFQAAAKRLAADLATSRNEHATANTRAVACYNAARILRWSGMELAGTELLPDTRFENGNYFFGLSPNPVFRRILPVQTFIDRPAGGCPPALTATQLRQIPPTIRFHYRLRAADLMLQAAALTTSLKLKAMALHIGGSWLRFRDPETADNLFLKRLIKECRGVDLGAAAAKRGCFPQNLTPWLLQQHNCASPELLSIADIPERLVEPEKPKAATPARTAP
jgi:hypothetical protein